MPPVVIATSLPITWQQTIERASHWVGLTLPGIIEEPEQVIEIDLPAVEDLTDEKEILPEKLTVIPGGYLSSSEGLTYINVPDYYLTINDAVTSLDFNEYRMLLVNKEYSVPAEFDNSNHDAETALLKMDEMIQSLWIH